MKRSQPKQSQSRTSRTKKAKVTSASVPKTEATVPPLQPTVPGAKIGVTTRSQSRASLPGPATPAATTITGTTALGRGIPVGVTLPRPTTTPVTSSPAPCPVPAASVEKNKKLTSEECRNRGNEFYKQFVNSSKSDVLGQKKLLQAAISWYRFAYNEALATPQTNPDQEKDACRAAKNCGTALTKIAHVFVESKTCPATTALYYKDAVENFSRALLGGTSCMDEDWIKGLKAVYTNCVQLAVKQAKNDLPTKARSGAIEQLIQGMTESSQKACCFWEIADMTFQEGVVALKKRDFKTALNALHECHRPMLELERFVEFCGQDLQDHYKTEVKVMKQELYFHLATAESLQAITIGDGLLKTAKAGTDTNSKKIDVNLLYNVMEWYGKAVVGAREIEVEVEAMALSRLGTLYDEILKMKSKAKEYFLRCIQLGTTLNRNDLRTEDWFKKAMDTLKRYQNEAVKLDDEVAQKERQKYMDELLDELSKLKNADNGTTSKELLEFIYQTHPPKDEKHKLPEEEIKNDQVKKGLLKAILHYHPDKQNVAEHGKKWQTLCGEITRFLTARYEAIKFM